jgi:TRAP-type C4-dicarboxylate transport system substrate-binding protein
MKKKISVLFIVLLSIALMGGFTMGFAKEKKIVWKFQTFVPETDADWYVTLKSIKALIEEGSGGKIEVKIFPVGVLTDPDSILDTVVNGAIQGGQIISGMAAGIAPSCLGTEMPYGTKDMYEHFELHFLWGLIDIMREEYAKRNLHLLTVGFSGQINFFSSFPVRSAGDFKGKKIWVIPQLTWLTKFGAATVEVPGMDMYTALKLGTLDGFAWTIGELEYGNFKEVVKYVSRPKFITPGTHILINKKAWDKLGKPLQTQIQDHVLAHQFKVYKEYRSYDLKSIKAAQDYGVKFIDLPPADVAKFKAAAVEFWNEVEGMSPGAAKMIKRYREFLKYKGR